MALKLITAATTYPVTLADAKLHCKVDDVADDALITAMITSATELAEQELGRALMAQTWEVTLDSFPDAFELTRVPVQSVTSVKYYDTTGTLQTLSGSLYSVDTADGDGFAYVTPAYNTSWPETRDQINAVSVRYVSGYTDAAAVPEPIKAWIKLMVAAMYENREAEAQAVRSNGTLKMQFVDRLLDRYRVAAL